MASTNHTPMDHQINPVFRALNRPLLLLGIDRRLFFFLLTVSFAVFNLSGALAPTLALFAALACGTRLAARTDPQLLRILMNSTRFAARYDPAKWCPTRLEKGVEDGPAEDAV